MTDDEIVERLFDTVSSWPEHERSLVEEWLSRAEVCIKAIQELTAETSINQPISSSGTR